MRPDGGRHARRFLHQSRLHSGEIGRVRSPASDISQCQAIERPGRCNDGYALVLFQFKQVRISRDNKIDPGSQCTDQNMVVVRVA